MTDTLVHFNHALTHQLEQGLSREWLEVDGRGGYAASTLLMCPTRRYHGLLVAVPLAASKRHVFLGRFEETVRGADTSFPISIARYANGVWSPHGHEAIEAFDLAPYPTFSYCIGGVRITREVMRVRGTPIVLCRYRTSGQTLPLELRLRPLLPYREADALTHENPHLDTRIERVSDGIRVRPYAGLPPLSITLTAAGHTFDADPVWYRNLEYAQDLARGYDGHEDNYCPGLLRIPLPGDGDVVVAATIAEPVPDPAALFDAERQRRCRDVPVDVSSSRTIHAMAAHDFLYRDGSGRTGVVAGFPWFGEWGRDTFIALPGLTLAGGDGDTCRAVLDGALPFLHNGLMPNIFGSDAEASQYGAVDASLWFARAVRLYDEFLGGIEHPHAAVIDSFLSPLLEIANAYYFGTDLNIATDQSGLLVSGSEDINGTWMDATTSDGPVTPRHGCAVETNALWYELMRYMARLLIAAGDDDAAATWNQRADRCATAFIEQFWLPQAEYLADRVLDGKPDPTIRPNMVIAAALADSPLTQEMRGCVVRVAEAELLTPRGLRTLAPDEPGYVGRYAGGPEDRDRAYHQGTVWPWLLGFYIEAYVRAFGPTAEIVAGLRSAIDSFADELTRVGLDHVSEVFDGDAPHAPGGTFAQAWNTAELLRAHRLLDEVCP